MLFLVASTNTVPVLGALVIYIFTLILVLLIAFVTDKVFKTKFRFVAAVLLLGSLVSIALGVLTFNLQEQWNKKTAEKFIVDIEKFRSSYGELPTDIGQINLPESRNGLYVEEFQYYKPSVEEESYIVKYFDGFWNTKVYRSDTKKWYTDD